MTPDSSAFAEPCDITAGAFCLTHRAGATDPRSEECVAMTLHAEVDRLREELEVRVSGMRDGRWEDPVGDFWRDYWRQRALEAEDFGIDLDDFRRAVESAYALLNPTEGETDHE